MGADGVDQGRRLADDLAASLDCLPIAVALFDAVGDIRIARGGLRGLLGRAVPARDATPSISWQMFDRNGDVLPKAEWPDARALTGADRVGNGLALRHSPTTGERALRLRVLPPAHPNGAGGGILFVEDLVAQSNPKRDAREVIAATLASQPDSLPVVSRKPPSMVMAIATADKLDPVALTERERQVLALVGWGISNKDTARLLMLHVKTVEAHRARAMRKLGLRHRYEVTHYALAHGWLAQPPPDLLVRDGNPP